jgi:hypothetical protein
VLFLGAPVVTGMRALAGAAAGGAFASLGVGATAIAAWALAWQRNKPAFDDMLDRLAIGRSNAADAAYIASRRAALPPDKRSAFDALQASHSASPVNTTVNVHLGAQQIAKIIFDTFGRQLSGGFGIRGVQGGTTGFDGSMSLLPAGMPAGAGN